MVTKDFFTRELPLTIPEECSILHAQELHKNAITHLKYSPSGTKLAAASQDKMISVLRTPVFHNKLEISNLGGADGTINSLHWSVSD